MSRLSPRELDRAVERRWPSLFRHDLRRTIWTVLLLQLLGLFLLLIDQPSSATGPVAASIGLLARCLLESKGDGARGRVGGHADRADVRGARAAKALADQTVIARQGGQGAGQGGVGGGMGI